MQFFKAGLAIVFSAALIAAPASATRTSHKAIAKTAPKAAAKAATGVAAKRSTKVSAKAPAKAGAKSHGRSARRVAVVAPKSHKLHGQQAIDSSRVTEIQQALIREHYMTGEATGSWDAETQAAMQKYQSDQGWQTKLIPDSRALKKLGLGADYSGAINASDVSFAPPAPASSIPSAQAAGFAQAAGVNQ